MNNTNEELSNAVRRYAAELGEEFNLRKNADLVHFGMWLLRQNSDNTNVLSMCEHDEVMRQGNGFVYGVCNKCGVDLY